MQNSDQAPAQPDICDYEGATYRTDFWEGKGRDYEDGAERIALRRLLPATGRRLLEVGAGFGRLTGEYDQFGQVVLLDYSFSQLVEARKHYGDARFVYVAADVYRMPFRPGIFDAATMIRVIHHMADAPLALRQTRRALAPGGAFVLEHANKRNLKAMLRYALRQQAWSPYTHEPVEFVPLNFDFHPQYITRTLAETGFTVRQRVPVSFFRLGLLKKTIPTRLLVGLDGLMQRSGLYVAPSIFVRADAQGGTPDNTTALAPELLFADPQTGAPLRRDGETMWCEQTGARYAIRDGVYDFKTPLGA